jgi:hypothetical protein
MPDGFNPGQELARIYTLKELMTECRARVPVMLRLIDEMLSDSELGASEKIKIIQMMFDRGFGKARQTVIVSESDESASRVNVYIPDNGRFQSGNKNY